MERQPLRILFMGTPDFAVPTLEALIQGPDEIIAVVEPRSHTMSLGTLRDELTTCCAAATCTSGCPLQSHDHPCSCRCGCL